MSKFDTYFATQIAQVRLSKCRESHRKNLEISYQYWFQELFDGYYNATGEFMSMDELIRLRKMARGE